MVSLSFQADDALDKGNIKTGAYHQVRAKAMFYTTVVIGFLIGMLACVYAVTVYHRSLISETHSEGKLWEKDWTPLGV